MWPFYCWCYESKQDCSNSIANALELLLCISSGVTANLHKAFHIVSSPSCLVFVGGDARRVVPEQLQHPSKLTQYQDFIYWTDFQTRSIHQANKTNGLNHTVIHQGYNMVTDLLIYHASRQAGQLTHWGRDKMAAISRRYFQVHFPEWKCLNSDWNFTQVCS